MSKSIGWLAVTLACLGAACSGGAKIDTVPVGAEVQLTRQDGGVLQGRLAALDRDAVRVTQGTVDRTVPRRDIVDVRIVDEKTPTPLPASARFRDVRVPDGTPLRIRLESTVASNASQVEDPVQATLIEPVRINSMEVLPAGSVLQGHVVEARPSARVMGRASLAVRFSTVTARGESYQMAADIQQAARGTKGRDAEKIGLPAAGGAIIGAIVGGKKGAAVGGAIGAGAGTAVVLTTAGDEVRWPRGAALTVPLDQPLDVHVPIRR